MIRPEDIAKTSEDSHCIALMAWCALNIKTYPQLKWLSHIPNGGARDLREGTKFKAMGVKRGFPDYFLAYPSKNYCGMFIELKIQTGKISKEQKDWIAHLSDVGYKAMICWSWEEARDELVKYLCPIKM